MKEDMTLKKQSFTVFASEIEFPDAEEFFGFMSSYYIDFWFIEAMPRKIDGGRGAPVAAQIEWAKKKKSEDVEPNPKQCHHERAALNELRRLDPGNPLLKDTYFPFKKPFGSKLVVWNLKKLLAYLMASGKKNIDMHIKASPNAGQYYRTILVDDLEQSQVELLCNWWSGPLAVIETSIGNFQAILVIADRYGLNSADKLTVARALQIKFNGDPGAVSTNQFHRFPGSSNNKLTVKDGTLPFISKLRILRESLPGRDGSDCIRGLLSTVKLTTGTREVAIRKKKAAPINRSLGVGGRDETPSGQAFRWTLKGGLAEPELVEGLIVRAGDRHDPSDWVARTIFNAKAVLAGSNERYVSRPK